MTATCRVCSAPLVSLPDLPDAHPGCAPVDAVRWEAETGGPRSYTGRSRPAVHEAGCRGCNGRIAVGELLNLADLPDGRAWAHAACDPETSPEGPSPVTASVGAFDPRETTSGDLSRQRRPIRADSTTEAPRRAA